MKTRQIVAIFFVFLLLVYLTNLFPKPLDKELDVKLIQYEIMAP
ncbi:hypothetical protein [Radiobacillus kanasensis]|nr:hypothetical protein [Radiobacillus kanasensis]